MTDIDKAEVIRHMELNKAAQGGIPGRFAVTTDIKPTAENSGVKLDVNDVMAWLPVHDVPAVVSALKKALASETESTTDVRHDETGVLQIGRRDYGIGVHISPVRAASRGETLLKLSEEEAETLHRALNVARHEIIGHFSEGRFL